MSEEDQLLCGSCRKTFLLSDIVQFMLHKNTLCGKYSHTILYVLTLYFPLKYISNNHQLVFLCLYSIVVLEMKNPCMPGHKSGYCQIGQL